MLTPKTLATATVLLLLFASCKKGGSNDKPKANTFHKDIVIRETIKGAEQAQNTLLLKSPSNDASVLISVASRGIYEGDAEGFRFMSLKKDKGVIISKSFTVSSAFTYQFATCATMDKNNNVWVAGHVFGGGNSYGKPFVAKLNTSGDLSFSKIYNAFDENDNPATVRAAGITALANGDILLTTFSSYGYQLLRLNTDGNITWKIMLPNNSPAPYFHNPYDVSPNLNNIVNIAAELADGSIVLHAFRSQVGVRDYLIKIDAQGNLVFAKRYIYESTYPSSSAQLVVLPDNKILWMSQKRGSVSGFPYAYILSANGEVLQSKGCAINAPVNNPIEINEVKYIDGKIFLTTTGGYEFDQYYLDMNLSVTSREKTLQSNIIYTDRGGMSAWDEASESMFHMIDVSGQLGEGNGFQFVKSDGSGKSCHAYSTPAEQLLFANITVTVENEPSIIIQPALKMTVGNFTWSVAGFSVESEDNMCED